MAWIVFIHLDVPLEVLVNTIKQLGRGQQQETSHERVKVHARALPVFFFSNGNEIEQTELFNMPLTTVLSYL